MFAGLEIPMNQPALFGRSQRTGDFQADGNRIDRAERPAASQPCFQSFALDKFHRVEAIASLRIFWTGDRSFERRQGVDRAEMENTGHVRMAQTRRGARLLQKALPRLGPCGVARIDQLQTPPVCRDLCRVPWTRIPHGAPTQFPAGSVITRLEFRSADKNGSRFLPRTVRLLPRRIQIPRSEDSAESVPPARLRRCAPHCSQTRVWLFVVECMSTGSWLIAKRLRDRAINTRQR